MIIGHKHDIFITVASKAEDIIRFFNTLQAHFKYQNVDSSYNSSDI